MGNWGLTVGRESIYNSLALVQSSLLVVQWQRVEPGRWPHCRTLALKHWRIAWFQVSIIILCTLSLTHGVMQIFSDVCASFTAFPGRRPVVVVGRARSSVFSRMAGHLLASRRHGDFDGWYPVFRYASTCCRCLGSARCMFQSVE